MNARVLERVFSECFALGERTRLLGGAEEPLYEPAVGGDAWHTIYYRHDYFASALHEVSHWCIAGRARRALRDYGYWYEPDGRDAQRQAAFVRAEAQPQALEWIFSQACGSAFRLSLDNLSGDIPAEHRQLFADSVRAAARRLQAAGPPARASVFIAALNCAFPGGRALPAMEFSAEHLIESLCA